VDGLSFYPPGGVEVLSVATLVEFFLSPYQEWQGLLNLNSQYIINIYNKIKSGIACGVPRYFAWREIFHWIKIAFSGLSKIALYRNTGQSFFLPYQKKNIESTA
jgi:hypothetical protein